MAFPKFSPPSGDSPRVTRFGNLLVIVFAIALAAFAAWQSRTHCEQQARISADNLAELLGRDVSGTIEKIDLVLRNVVLEVEQRQAHGKTADLNRLLAHQRAFLPDADSLLIADAEGVVIHAAEALPELPVSVADRDYFSRLRSDSQAGLVVDGPFRSGLRGDWVMAFSRRISRPDGAFAGVVAAAVRTDRFTEQLSSVNLGANGMASLRTGQLTPVARHPALAQVGDNRNKAVPAEYESHLAANPNYGFFVAINPVDGIERAVAYRRLAEFPLYVAVGLATQDYLAAWWIEVIQWLGVVALLGSIAEWLSRRARRAARRQRESSRLLQEAVGSVALGFSIFDAEDRLVISNGGPRDLFIPHVEDFMPGTRFEDIVRVWVKEGMYPDAEADPEAWIAERLRLHRLADGKPCEQRLRGGNRLLIIEHRTASGHVVVNRIDITELCQYRDRLERLVEFQTLELRQSAAQFRIFVEQAPTAISMLDRHMNYLAVSRRWLQDYGRGLASLVGRNHYDVYPRVPDHWRAVHRAALGGSPQEKEEDLLVWRSGRRQWLRWTAYPWRDEHGTIGGIVMAAEDITDRKEAEQALAEEREVHHRLLEERVAERTEELQAANRQLEGFLYAASHDLKGPLGRISSFSTLLERNYRDRLDGDGLVFLDFIRSNAIRLSRLIDDLLCHARIDQQLPDLRPIDLGAAIQAALRDKAEDIRETGTVVRLASPPARVLADPYGLTQVLSNLLENALKYSAQISEPVIEMGGEAVGNHFRLWIRDNGIGFDMEYHDRIFEIFRRLHTYAEYAGSGVGLALVKRAMERMGGKVWAESELGQGATFYLELKIAPDAPAAAAALAVATLPAPSGADRVSPAT